MDETFVCPLARSNHVLIIMMDINTWSKLEEQVTNNDLIHRQTLSQYLAICNIISLIFLPSY